MPMRQYLNLLKSSYSKDNARSVVPQRLKNMFLEPMPVVGGVKMSAYSCPGHEEWIDLGGDYYTRGAVVHKDLLYVCNSTNVYQIDTDGIAAGIGAIDAPSVSTDERMSIAATNDNITFCNGSKAWNYKVSTATFSQVTDADLPSSTTLKQVLAFGEYTLYLIQDSQTVFVSDVSDATSINALSQFNAQTSYDDLVAIGTAQSYLYLFGSTTTEIWYNSGANFVPFDKVTSFNYGLVSSKATCVVNNELYFLAKDINGVIGLMKYSGTSPTILLNTSLNEKLRTYEAIDNCYFWVDSHDGHQFVNMTFPTSTSPIRSTTHSYDITTDVWFERETWNPQAQAQAGYEGHPAQWCVYFNNKQYFGSRFDGTIHEMSLDIYDDNGYAMVRELITPYILTEEQYFSVSSLEVDLERSVALTSGQGSDPVLSLWVTNNRQGTWQGAFQRQAGKIGEYAHRALWQSCGGGRSMAFKLSYSEPTPFVIHGITAEIFGEVSVARG